MFLHPSSEGSIRILTVRWSQAHREPVHPRLSSNQRSLNLEDIKRFLGPKYDLDTHTVTSWDWPVISMSIYRELDKKRCLSKCTCNAFYISLNTEGIKYKGRRWQREKQSKKLTGKSYFPRPSGPYPGRK